MRARAILLVVIVGCGNPTTSSTPTAASPSKALVAPTIPPEDPPPTLRLPTHVAPIAYRASIRLDPAQPTFTASIEIDVAVQKPTTVVWLNAVELVIAEAHAVRGAERIALAVKQHDTDLLALRAPRPLDGSWTLVLRYGGKLRDAETRGLFRQQEGNDWYALTQFEPPYARRVFPCFDEPDRKTPWQLTLEVPAQLVALANTKQIGEASVSDHYKRVTFAQTRRLPSYLIAFAVGPFELVSAGASRTGVPIRIAALRGRAKHTALAVDAVPKTLAALEDYVGSPYPYDKLDFVPAARQTSYGCMENPGLVTCDPRIMWFDPVTATPDDRRSVVFAAAHELGHQWFGNLVTMAWWDDLWLNEGIVTWIERRIIDSVDPRPDNVFDVVEAHERALRADRLTTARAARRPITTKADVESAVDPIQYDKAAAVMTMFERWIGPETFQRGIRAYLAAHADGNATTADLLAAMQRAANRDVSAISSFVDQPGAPQLDVELSCAATPKLLVAQRRFAPPGSPPTQTTLWKIPVCVAYDRDGTRDETCSLVETAHAEIELPARACPKWVMPNANSTGHYRLALSKKLAAAAIDGWKSLTPVERVALAQDFRAMIRAGTLDLEQGFAIARRLLAENNAAAIEMATTLANLRTSVPAAKLPAFDRWLVEVFGPPARKLGWTKKQNEPSDTQRRRAALVPLAAEAGDRALSREAIKLSRSWRTLARDARPLILQTAIRTDTGTFDRIHTDLAEEKDLQTRQVLRYALAQTTDSARLDKVLQMMLDTRVDFREVAYLPYQIWREPQRTQAERFIRDNMSTLVARHTDAPSPAALAGMFTSACDPERREEIVAFVKRTFSTLPRGEHMVAQRVESMDQCIAWKKLAAPQIVRWLDRQRP